MITVTGQPTFDDYLRAQRHHGRSRALLIAGILGALAILVWLTSRSIIFPAFVVLYVILLRPLYMRVRLRRHWQQTPSAHQGQKTYGLGETGFRTEDDEGHPSVTHWDKFLKFRESKHTFFLYLSPNMYLFLPKRFIGPENQERIRQLLKESIEQPSARDTSKGADDLTRTRDA